MEINECNELIFTELIYNKMLDELNIEEIIAVIGMFIDSGIDKENMIYSIDHLDVPDNVKNVLNQINEITMEMSITDTDIMSNWTLVLDFIQPAYMWAKGYSLNQIYEIIEMYEGNFIVNIIKINKICQDILKICDITKNDILRKKIILAESLLMRDIVLIESLYI
jgi:antiviral helicase SKI2